MTRTVSFLALLGILTISWCLPSFNGYSGLFYVPTAEVLPANSWSVGAFSVDLDEVFPDRYCFSYGLPGGMELNVIKYVPDDEEEETLLSGKYQIFPETKDKPALAVGVFDVTEERETTVYLVASRTLSDSFEVRKRRVFETIGHIGVGGGRLEGIFAGVEFVLAPSFRVIGEYDTDDFNIGIKILANDKLAITGAVLDLDRLGVGISFKEDF